MKQILSHQQIDTILDSVFPKSPFEPIQNTINKNREVLRRQIEKIMIDPEIIPSMIEELKRLYHKSIIQPGECVGVLCAQSIGERQTQNTLNSFHSTGVAIETVLTGVPRFLEILNATKEPKLTSSRFVLRKKDIQSIKEIRNHIGSSLIGLYLKNMVLGYSIGVIEEDWYRYYETIYGKERFREMTGCVRFVLDRSYVYKHNIDMGMVKKKIEEAYEDCCCVFSPIPVGRFDVFFDVSKVQESVPDVPYIREENKIQIYSEEVVVPQLYSILLDGIENIEDYFISKDLTIQTKGNNFIGLLGYTLIEQENVVSNNMWDIYNYLGVECAYNFLLQELRSVTSADGTYMNPCHTMLLADIMTHHGTIISISRYSLKKENIGPLAKASFEECLDNFLKAAFYSEVENTQSVSASIMCGKRSRIGTGLPDVMFSI
jgi:DNA-directed RNA polymerase beta' subunit